MSRESLTRAWIEAGGYDGILGFSNGAAAAALFAVHLTESKSVRLHYHRASVGLFSKPLMFHCQAPLSHSPPHVLSTSLRRIRGSRASVSLSWREATSPSPLAASSQTTSSRQTVRRKCQGITAKWPSHPSCYPCAELGPVSRLRSPLPVPSLHLMGREDSAVPPDESASLAHRWVYSSQEWTSIHCS